MEKKKGGVLSVILRIFCVLLGIIIFVGALNVIYYPHYKKNASVYDIGEKAPAEDIRIVSANVRTWSPTDLGTKSWFYRADLLIKSVTSVNPDVIGFQEVTKMHYSYLTENLKGYDSVLTYRDTSPFSEGCPVFYNTYRFELKDKGSFWLSETPEEMSKDWGAACYRICSYVILTDKESGKDLVVFNTHLDHISDEARINGINVVLEKIKQFGGLPSIIMGDFNAEEDSDTYRAATENFYDAKYQTEVTARGATYQNWGKQLDRENIDYFMISKEGIAVNEYRIIDDLYDGAYPSDHFPITVSITLD
jgi:endonuclease/exonuclease/phosphatase family metal-dependent hydrolase